MQEVNFETAGDGLWSNVAKDVRITDMQVGCIETDFQGLTPEFGELRVMFDTQDWNVDEDGLIYTDSLFLARLQDFLNEHGLVGRDVSYSEQGMQGDDYVSLDVGERFLKSWGSKFNIDWDAVAKAQEAAFKARWGV